MRERKDDRERMERRKKRGKERGEKKIRLRNGRKREGERAYLHIALPMVKRKYH